MDASATIDTGDNMKRTSSKHRHVCVFIFFLYIFLLPFFSNAQAIQKPPIVFAHGLGAPYEVYEHLLPMKKYFQEQGYPFYVAHTPLAGSLRQRCEILFQEIGRLVPYGKFHLLGHSMGGLDARCVVYRYGLGDRCLSVTTLATPHHGSPVADFVLENIQSNYVVVRKVLALVGFDIQGVHDLSKEYLDSVFNIKVVNDPRVKYYSAGFYIPEPIQRHSLVPWLWATHYIISQAGQPDNDGLVSIESSRWGEFLGAFPGDHLSSTIYSEVLGHVIERLQK